MREALYVLRGGGGLHAGEHEAVDLQPFIQAGLLLVLTPDTEAELASFLAFAAHLDDGEAMTCALAMHRGLGVASDDRKVRPVLAARAPQVPVYTTTEIVKAWADAQQPAPSTLRQILTDIRARARFAPGRHDPLLGWWESVLDSP